MSMLTTFFHSRACYATAKISICLTRTSKMPTLNVRKNSGKKILNRPQLMLHNDIASLFHLKINEEKKKQCLVTRYFVHEILCKVNVLLNCC